MSLVAAYGIKLTLKKSWNSNREKIGGVLVLIVMFALSVFLAAAAPTWFEPEVKMPETAMVVRIVTLNPMCWADTTYRSYIDKPYLRFSRVSPAMAERLVIQLPAGTVLAIFPECQVISNTWVGVE